MLACYIQTNKLERPDISYIGAWTEITFEEVLAPKRLKKSSREDGIPAHFDFLFRRIEALKGAVCGLTTGRCSRKSSNWCSDHTNVYNLI